MKWSVSFFLTFTDLIGWHQVGWSCVLRIYRSLHGLQVLERPFLGAGSIHHDNNKYIKKNSSNSTRPRQNGWFHTNTFTLTYIWKFLSTHTHLLENKRLLIPHWVNGVGCGGPLGAILLLGVSRKPNDLHFDSCFHILVRQKLARIDLMREVNNIWGHTVHVWIANSMDVSRCVDPCSGHGGYK